AKVLVEHDAPERAVAGNPVRSAVSVPGGPIARIRRLEKTVLGLAERGLPQKAAHEARIAEGVARDIALHHRVADVLTPLAPWAVHESLVHAGRDRVPSGLPDAIEQRIAAGERSP